MRPGSSELRRSRAWLEGDPPPAARSFTRTSLAITAMHTAILAGCVPHHVTRGGGKPRPFPHLPLLLRPRLSAVAPPCLPDPALIPSLSCQALAPPILSLSLASGALVLQLSGGRASLAAYPVLQHPRHQRPFPEGQSHSSVTQEALAPPLPLLFSAPPLIQSLGPFQQSRKKRPRSWDWLLAPQGELGLPWRHMT